MANQKETSQPGSWAIAFVFMLFFSSFRRSTFHKTRNSFRRTNPSFGSAARVGKCGDRCDPEDHREDNAAVAINSYRPLLLLGVIEDEGRHNLDEGKENEQRAREDKSIQSRHVW